MKTRLLIIVAFAVILSFSSLTTVLATQFLVDTTLHPESDESREQLERYCTLQDKPILKDDLFHNNSTHFLSSETCTWLEIPVCGKGTAFVDGSCHVLKLQTTHGDCLIATASYGSELAPQVQMLREIRDNILLNTESGKIFMSGFNSIYYLFSPTIAQWEDDSPIFKESVKLFITPMVTTLSIMTFAEGSELDVILYGLSTIVLIVGMYVVVPVMLIWKVKK
ncbi:CFI-box-CTERM domain-containing protein [Nitrosopumilus sp.]|uniref:CFI-box-CTERM domain-containing protein n=1 Tax=Nitrosopumilus sp. TaxID=2024843 RepID=UPI00247BCE82|nr:CFI-box-CTERM domain-containing protein [Nitrosopumilus sp.]MCV0410145.1 hypothetical protein [Nitrosopumilus sp.]